MPINTRKRYVVRISIANNNPTIVDRANRFEAFIVPDLIKAGIRQALEEVVDYNNCHLFIVDIDEV